MLAYQLRLAWISLRRNPILSVLMIAGIALGIAVSMTFVTAHYMMSGNPIPHKSDRLYYVQMDSWDPERPWSSSRPDEPPDQLTYMDAMAVTQSEIPTYQTVGYKGYYTIHPEAEGQRPFREIARMCYGDFFPMFDVPFRYGSGWSREADQGPEPVVVLSEPLNQRLFGGENSVGRNVRIEDRDFRVVGVLEHWRPMPKFYDTHNGPFHEAEEVFLPFGIGIETEMSSWGNTNCWKALEDSYEGLLRSECSWIQVWTQLDTAEQREEYRSFLDAYVAEQRKLGRFQRPTNNKLRDVMAWLRYEEVVPEEARALLINALLFLLICSVNLIGILLGKFLGRAPEVGVRRALGASRRWVFAQHLLECELIGLMGAALGLVLTAGSLRLLDRLFDTAFDFRLDLNLYLVALALALVSAMIAGAYPAWRICRVQPGVYLKTQ